MENKVNDSKMTEGKAVEKAELFYKKTMRVVEYYVLICFVLISFVPLLNYVWVPLTVKFIYLTGGPLLIILFIISFLKEPIINLLSAKFSE